MMERSHHHRRAGLSGSSSLWLDLTRPKVRFVGLLAARQVEAGFQDYPIYGGAFEDIHP